MLKDGTLIISSRNILAITFLDPVNSSHMVVGARVFVWLIDSCLKQENISLKVTTTRVPGCWKWPGNYQQTGRLGMTFRPLDYAFSRSFVEAESTIRQGMQR